MTETIRVGTHVRVFEEGSFIGCGVYMGTGPVNIAIPTYPLTSEMAITSVEMDSGHVLCGEFEFELSPRYLH